MFYSPIVEELCNRNDVSQKELEYELDGMLDFVKVMICLVCLKGFVGNFINIQKLLQVIS